MKARTVAWGLLLGAGVAAVAARGQEKPAEPGRQAFEAPVLLPGNRPTFIRCGDRFINADQILYSDPRRGGEKPVVWVYFLGAVREPLQLVGAEAEAFNKAMGRLAE